MLYFGIILVVLSPVLIAAGRRRGQLAAEMKRGHAVPVNRLQAGTANEVYGNAVADQPLTTPFSRQPSVYYEYEIKREVADRDSRGRSITRWETLGGDKRSIPFWIQDRTGAIAVYPDGAEIDARPLGERGLTAADTAVSRVIGETLNNLTGGRAMVAEKALLVNNPVYAYGQVSGNGQQLAISKGGGRMIVSYRNEAKIEAKIAASKKIMVVISVIMMVAGIVLIAADLIN